MNSQDPTQFAKYKNFGAYHWSVFDRDPRRHDLFTYTRYQVALENAAIIDGMKVLDFGCGDGVLTYLVWKQNVGGRTIGIEPESVGRNLAQQMFQKRNASIIILESSEMISDNSQDIVLCADVIEHVEDPDDLLVEIHRITKPEGRVVFSTPVRINEFPQDKEHVREFFPLEFNNLIKGHFNIVNHDFCTSVFALELYTWKPVFFLKRPLFGWIMSFLNIWFNVNIMMKFNTNNNLWTTQIITAVK